MTVERPWLKGVDVVLTLAMLLYIAQIPSLPLVVGFSALVLLILTTALIRQPGRTLSAIVRPNGDFLLVVGVYSLYVVFSTRNTIFADSNSFSAAAAYGLMIVTPFLLMIVYGSRSQENALRLSRAFFVALLCSIAFYALALIFPAQIAPIRYFLYSRSIDQLQASGLAPTGPLSSATGLSPYMYLFGYQVAAVSALVLGFLMTARRHAIRWAVLTIFVIVAAMFSTQRSVLVAALLAFLFVLWHANVAPRAGVLIYHARRTLFLIVASAIASVLAASAVETLFPGHAVQLSQERVGNEDVGIRAEMQLAALQIIAMNPLGLVAQGLPEEAWGSEARRLGYRVQADSNNVDDALVHNGFLRLVMYQGWWAGVVIGLVAAYLIRKILRVRSALAYSFDAIPPTMVRNWIVLGSAFVGLTVQSLFHNESIFTIERTSWVSVGLLLIYYRHFRKAGLVE